jgi:hypothetical protein
VVLVRKYECKRLFGRSKRRWGYNNETDLREIRFCGLDWIYVVRGKGRGLGGLGGEYCTSGNTLGGFRQYE